PYNVMTPTSDGFNDVFIIQNITGTDIYTGAIIKVFDRWGQQVFMSKGNKPQFDALAHPYKLPTGTYVYSIKPEEDYPEVVGEITIIR
ncbi:MAG: gliding motility-associated C-terminal domain-containing protein, partial [Aquirufa sp.]